MRRPSTITALFAGVFALGGFIAGAGTTVAVTPDPKPEIKTITHDVPPACVEALDAAQLAHDLDESVDQHRSAAVIATEGLMPPLLAGDAAEAADITAASEKEKHLAVAAQTKRDAALGDFESGTANCTPEVDR